MRPLCGRRDGCGRWGRRDHRLRPSRGGRFRSRSTRRPDTQGTLDRWGARRGCPDDGARGRRPSASFRAIEAFSPLFEFLLGEVSPCIGEAQFFECGVRIVAIGRVKHPIKEVSSTKKYHKRNDPHHKPHPRCACPIPHPAVPHVSTTLHRHHRPCEHHHQNWKEYHDGDNEHEESVKAVILSHG